MLQVLEFAFSYELVETRVCLVPVNTNLNDAQCSLKLMTDFYSSGYICAFLADVLRRGCA